MWAQMYLRVLLLYPSFCKVSAAIYVDFFVVAVIFYISHFSIDIDNIMGVIPRSDKTYMHLLNL